jgi:hypothetical protein
MLIFIYMASRKIVISLITNRHKFLIPAQIWKIFLALVIIPYHAPPENYPSIITNTGHVPDLRSVGGVSQPNFDGYEAEC